MAQDDTEAHGEADAGHQAPEPFCGRLCQLWQWDLGGQAQQDGADDQRHGGVKFDLDYEQNDDGNAQG
nr:hypothetical protein [Nesterenkonia sedimenti]